MMSAVHGTWVRARGDRSVAPTASGTSLLVISLLILGSISFAAEPAEAERAIQNAKTLVKSGDFEGALDYLQKALAKHDGPALRFQFADVLVLLEREDEALSIFEALRVALREKLTAPDPSEKDKQLLQQVEKRIEALTKGMKDLRDLDRKQAKVYLAFARRMISQGNFHAAEGALDRVETLDPGDLETETLAWKIQGARRWRDLTAVPHEAERHLLDSFGINRAPSFAQEAIKALQKDLPKLRQTYIFLHPPHRVEGFINYKLPSPVQSFKGRIVLTSPHGGEAVFRVLAAGKEVFSAQVKSGDPPLPVKATFPATAELKLIVDPHGAADSDHCSWLEPQVR